MIQSNIENIFSGEKENITDSKNKNYLTSYRKKMIEKDIYVNILGFENDTQSDKKHHGGIDKAVCVYSKKYYEYFEFEHNIKLPKCAMGENITLLDLDDSEVCLGDQYKCGEVIFEVSQPRKPCWKISSVLGIKELTQMLINEFKTGFYLRVLKEGVLNKDSKFELISRPHKEINIVFINQTYVNKNKDDFLEILKCEELADSFRVLLEKKLNK